jgi:uncharacterized protein (TIGR03435 family)
MRLSLILICARVLCAQTPPAFEIADVHASAPGTTESGGFLPNSRAEFRGVSLLRLITTAYSMPSDRVFGGPRWLETERFDVTAQAANATPSAAMRTMLRALLADRFQLSVTLADMPQAVYVLTLVKGPQRESAGAGDTDCKFESEENVQTLTCRHISISEFATRLQGLGNGYFDRPVIDRTGLQGVYDFKLAWLPRWQLPPGGQGATYSLFNSVEKQLGLRIEEDTIQAPSLVVERANRTPSENPAGVIEKLGTPPTEFDVVDIHPSAPDTKPNTVMTGGRFEVRGMPLKDLIALAYNIDPDWIRGGQKWLETERFDIRAKSVPTASNDTLRRMVQALLADRFHLKIHKENQAVSVYALKNLGRQKMKDADPESRATCKLATTAVRTLTCRNTTMAQLSERLRSAAPNYIDHVVVDLTGLKGGYDFELSWGNALVLLARSGRGGASEGGAPAAAAADPPVGLTIFEAVDRALGLKLAAQKHSMPVVVIDRVERTPTEN